MGTGTVNFWISEGIKVMVLYSTAYLLGLWVIMKGVKVNYTRKIFHFMLFFLPVFLSSRLQYQGSLVTIALSGGIFLMCIASLWEPFRRRSRFLAVAFASVDRPEDRPYTLVWVLTQVAVTYLILILTILLLSLHGKEHLIYISVLVAGIGDGLAEPVGVRFGKHTYRVPALLVDRVYTRSFEGSACVFLTAVLAVSLFHNSFNLSQYLLALGIIPTAMTLAEALSPHTWDGPLLYLSGGVSISAVFLLSKLFGVG